MNIQIKKQLTFSFRMSMLFLFFFTSLLLNGQIITDDIYPEDIPLDSIQQPQDSIEIPVETLDLESFYLSSMHRTSAYKDSVLEYRFFHYNPVFEQDEPYLFLGNNGSAAVPATQIKNRQTGFDLGISAYDIYSMELDSFQWFKTNVPFSDLYFSNGPTEEEFRVMAKFTSNLGKQLNFNIDFERILENGYYLNQATKQSMISLGFWHRSENEKSNTFFTYVGNVHQEQNNGGIKDTISLSEPLRKNIPVTLSSAVGRLQKNHYAISNYYNISLKPDSLSSGNSLKFDLFNQLSFENGFFKYYDERTSFATDSSYYGDLLIDDIGLRNYMTFNKLGLFSSFSTRFKWESKLSAGIAYNWWRLDKESIKKDHLHELYVKGNLEISPIKGLDLSGRVKFHFGSFLGDFKIDLDGRYELSEIIQLKGRHLTMLSHPGQIERSFYINTQLVQSNDFKQINTNQTEASISIPKFGFHGGFTFYQINNQIYFDKQKLFTQLDSPLNILEVHAGQHVALRQFHLKIKGYYYLNNTETLDIPQFQLESMIYFKGPILKERLLLDSGFEFKLLDGFFVPGYQGLVGQFYPQADYETKIYPLLNFYLGFKIKSVRFFVRSENILNAITGDVHYLSHMHPQNDFRMFRVGVRWQFIN